MKGFVEFGFGAWGLGWRLGNLGIVSYTFPVYSRYNTVKYYSAERLLKSTELGS